MTGGGAATDPTLEEELHAFRELMLVPGARIDFGALGSSQAMKRVRSAEEARRLTDWANLGRYRAGNHILRANGSAAVVFVGASIIENWAQADPELFTNGCVNRGIGGQTSAHVLLRFMADVVRLGPRVVHLMVGTNDAAGNAGPVSDEEFRNNVVSMVEIAEAHGIRVIVSSIPPAGSFPWQPDVDPIGTIARWNGWLREFADERGHVYADYVAVLADGSGGMRAELTNDGVHPHRLGYDLMRPIVERALREALDD